MSTSNRITQRLKDKLDLTQLQYLMQGIAIDQPLFQDFDPRRDTEVRFNRGIHLSVIEQILQLGNIPLPPEITKPLDNDFSREANVIRHQISDRQSQIRNQSYPIEQVKQGVIQILTPAVEHLLLSPRERWVQMRDQDRNLVLRWDRLEPLIRDLLT